MLELCMALYKYPSLLLHILVGDLINVKNVMLHVRSEKSLSCVWTRINHVLLWCFICTIWIFENAFVEAHGKTTQNLRMLLFQVYTMVSWNLRENMFKHTRKRPHKCNIFYASFAFVHRLKSHMLKHSQEQPHKYIYKEYIKNMLLHLLYLPVWKHTCWNIQESDHTSAKMVMFHLHHLQI